jgi:LAS superfamily LD-carboxypeptidase LdcB
MPMGLDAGWSNQNLLRNPYRFSGLFLRPPRVLSITGTPAPDHPVGHNRSPAIGIPALKLTPADTEEETAFKHQVYEAHCRRASRSNEYFGGLSTGLTVVEHGYEMRSDAAAAAKALLAEARAALKKQQDERDEQALKVTSIAVGSGYRDPQKDFGLWDSYYQGYYDETREERSVLPGGEHGPKAVAFMVKHIGKYKAAPGYSNHTRGIAFDINTTEGKVHYTAKKTQNAAWEKTWLRKWLLDGNAARHGFHPIATEAWHWEYKP